MPQRIPGLQMPLGFTTEGCWERETHILRASSLKVKLLTEKSQKLLLLCFEPASGNWKQYGKIWAKNGKIYRSRPYTLDFWRFFPSPLWFLFSQRVPWLIYGTVTLKWTGDNPDDQAKMICICLTAILHVLNSAPLFSNNLFYASVVGALCIPKSALS